MKNVICKVRLLSQIRDSGGYTTYGFVLLDREDIELTGTKYVVCVRYPNWNCKAIKNGDVGILHFVEILAGKDAWYNGNGFTPYRYNAWQFLKFIPEQEEDNNQDIYVD